MKSRKEQIRVRAEQKYTHLCDRMGELCPSTAPATEPRWVCKGCGGVVGDCFFLAAITRGGTWMCQCGSKHIMIADAKGERSH